MTALPEEQQGRYSCPVCSLRFKELREKKAHIREHHHD